MYGDADLVPVGEDQVAHVELTREIVGSVQPVLWARDPKESYPRTA